MRYSRVGPSSWQGAHRAALGGLIVAQLGALVPAFLPAVLPRLVATLLPALVPATAQAWVLTINPGRRALYLQVGVGSANADNSTVNVVSVTVPAAQVGSGTAQAMTSDSTAAISFFDNFVVCTPPQQVYVGAFFRQPSTTANAASLQVSTPPALTSGPNSIAFTEISWTSTALGNPTADIPPGTFSGGTQFLRSIGSNRWVENCLSFSYANTGLVPAGTFTGRATYTLTAP
jgi:hypothetical protein